MAITRDSRHKRRHTGGRRAQHIKKRKYETGRVPANTRIASDKRITLVRCRGGNTKRRALRLETGNYSWGGFTITRAAKINDVVYNSSNNELVRTKTLVKGEIVEIDAVPFRKWYESHFKVKAGSAGKEMTAEAEVAIKDGKLREAYVNERMKEALSKGKLDEAIEDQLVKGRILAKITSRPGQCGRADGYILEGKELEFYLRKLREKKGKKAQ